MGCWRTKGQSTGYGSGGVAPIVLAPEGQVGHRTNGDRPLLGAAGPQLAVGNPRAQSTRSGCAEGPKGGWTLCGKGPSRRTVPIDNEDIAGSLVTAHGVFGGDVFGAVGVIVEVVLGDGEDHGDVGALVEVLQLEARQL